MKKWIKKWLGIEDQDEIIKLWSLKLNELIESQNKIKEVKDLPFCCYSDKPYPFGVWEHIRAILEYLGVKQTEVFIDDPAYLPPEPVKKRKMILKKITKTKEVK